MFLGAENLVGVIGSLVYDVAKETIKDLGGYEDKDSLANKMHAAADRACKSFYNQYGTQFGKPEESFLARRENWETIIASFRYDRKKLEVTDLSRDGDPGVNPVTIEALAQLLHFLNTEVYADPELGQIFADKSHFDKTDSMDKKLDSILLWMPSYDSDAKTLLDHTERNLRYARHLSEIEVGDNKVKINRKSTEALVNAVQSGSLLIVGDPGAGKSGAIYDLVLTLQQEGNEVVFLPVDRINAANYGVLREDLDLHHNIESIIDNWPGDKPCVLVLDALDAARSDDANKTLRNLMEVTTGNERWRVVASIRRFDLRYSTSLRRLFKGNSPSDYASTEFAGVRHINIPLLSEEELMEALSGCSELAAVVENSDEYLKQMIRTPFNLRLVAELISDGTSKDHLKSIKTQHELLERYWDSRVIDIPGNADERERVLRGIVTDLIARRSMQIFREKAAIINPDALQQLLSSNILVEWEAYGGEADRYTLAFSHHILFDYAVARIIFRGPQEKVLHALEADPMAVVALRPSLTHMFSYLWSSEKTRRRFWDFIIEMTASSVIPEVGKLIGPSTAVELADSINDFQPVIEQILQGDDVQALPAKILEHVIGAIVVTGERDKSILVGNSAGPWCDFLESVTVKCQRKALYAAHPLLMEVCKRDSELNDSQLESIGLVARRLLDFAWGEAVRNDGIITQALRFVCRTHQSDAAASAALLRRSLAPEHLSKYGYQEMRPISWEIKNLIPLDISLVEEIYKIAFTFRDNKSDITAIGGRILPLSSNRRQDYEAALYSFTEAYPLLLKEAPIAATRVVISAIGFYIEHEEKLSSDASRGFFDFLGNRSEIIEDRSHSWDATNYRYDDPIKLMDTFVDYAMSLGDDDKNIDLCRQILNEIAQKNRYAVLWQKVIKCGNEKPDTWGVLIRPLAWVIPILTNMDTLQAIGIFIEKYFPQMNEEERYQVEVAILSIPNAFGENEQFGKYFCKRLTCRLNPEYMINQRIKDFLEEIRLEKGIISNTPICQSSRATFRSYTNEQRLTDQGVDFAQGRNREFHDLTEGLNAFSQQYLNEKPKLIDVIAIMPTITKTHDTLSRDCSDIHMKLIEDGADGLAKACACVAQLTQDDGLNINDLLRIREIMLLLVKVKPQIFDHDTARIYAASGLMYLVPNPELYNEAVRLAIHNLIKDESRAVRSQIVRFLSLLSGVDTQIMWDLIGDCSENENNAEVLAALFNSLFVLWEPYPDEITAITTKILRRIEGKAGTKTVREHCFEILVASFIWKDNKTCQDILEAVINNPEANALDIAMIIPELRNTMNSAFLIESEYNQIAVNRTWALVRQTVSNLVTVVRSLSDVESEIKRTLLRCIDSIGLQIFFASGAHEEKKEAGVHCDSDNNKQFLNHAEETVRLLINYPLPSLIHHLVEMLKFLIEGDPRRVFLLLGAVIEKSREGFYHYETMGADLTVSIIERYLAEYRHVLRDPDCEKSLICILDIFVEAGWPQARRLTYRLEEIYR